MQPGDRVRWVVNGDEGIVVRPNGDRALVQFPGEGQPRQIHVEELEVLGEASGPLDPADDLAEGHLGDAEAYALRLRAFYLQHAHRFDPLSGLSSARIEPKLHQLFVAHTVTRKLWPRMILADEVGLGKTIEAGLVLKELKARKLIRRTLIVTPASLVSQWQSEMQTKFNERFEIVDGPGLKFLGRDGSNPWKKHEQVICSIHLARAPSRRESILDGEWDLVIFDEAHHVRRRGENDRTSRKTLAYELADELKEVVWGLLLLTATPMQLHQYELFSMVELVEPGLFRNFAAYERVRRDVPRLNDLMRALKGWDAFDGEEKAAAVQKHLAFLNRSETAGQDDPLSVLDEREARERVMDELVDGHPHAGVMVRNRKAEIGGFSKREASRHLIAPSDAERELYQQVTTYIRTGYERAQAAKNYAVGFLMVNYQKMLTSSSAALRTSFARRVQKLRKQLKEVKAAKGLSKNRVEELRGAPETTVAVEEVEALFIDEELLEDEIQELEGYVERLGQIQDAKAELLLEVVKPVLEGDDEKVVIFTQFLETQRFISDVLKAEGVRCALFNGSLKPDEKEDAIRKFRGPCEVLISSEAGGEGRNLQFARNILNYDLPWNPMKVEQRIGRLDRIGQHRTVRIFNLGLEGTVEERVLNVLANRIRVFEESVGSLDPILGDIEYDLEQIILTSASPDEAFDRLEVDAEKRAREAKVREETFADFILDRASFRHDEANDLLGRSPLGRHTDLQDVVGEGLEYWGGTLAAHTEGGEVITLSQGLRKRLRTADGAIRGCFDPRVAMELEEIDFFAFGHPVVDGIVRLAAEEDPEVTACRSLRSIEGGPFVEIFYELQGHGLRPSGRLIRHLVSEDLRVESQEVVSIPETGRPSRIGVPEWITSAVEASRAAFEEEHESERERILLEDEQVKKEEIQRAERELEYQRVRLRSLIDEAEVWIAEVEDSGSEGQKRVLPARRGKLRKDRERLAFLEEAFDDRVERIRARRPGVSGRVIGAGLVVGAG